MALLLLQIRTQNQNLPTEWVCGTLPTTSFLSSITGHLSGILLVGKEVTSFSSCPAFGLHSSSSDFRTFLCPPTVGSRHHYQDVATCQVYFYLLKKALRFPP